MARIFLDTNILSYAIDDGNPGKQTAARAVIGSVVSGDIPVISTQVLQEFYNASTTKLNIDKLIAKKLVHNFSNMSVVQITPAIIEQGIDISITAQISFWDGLIIAAAECAECSLLLSEDLNDGQVIRGVQIANPFKEPGEERETPTP